MGKNVRVWGLAAMLVVLASAAVGILARSCRAFYPAHCNLRNAKMDPEHADAIVIGRVVGVAEVVSKDGGDAARASYVAALRVGQVLKGQVHVGNVVHFVLGSRFAADDSTPTLLSIVSVGHRAYDVSVDGVYLVFLTRVPADDSVPDALRNSLWKLRSCHFSIHELVRIDDDTIGVLVGSYLPREEAEPVPLADFLRDRKLK